MWIYLTVQKDFEKVIAYCEAVKGNYAILAHSTDEEQAKQMFNSMKSDMDKHLQFLNDRLEYIKQNNKTII